MKKKLSLLLICLSAVFMFSFAIAEPSGAEVTPGTSSRMNATEAGNHSAQAGNLTEITLYSEVITRSWQGYFGNVSGAIRLADSSGNNMYNWSLASASGQVYATYNSSISWTEVECLDWATEGEDLESLFGVSSTHSDRVNETFSDSTDHSGFLVGSKEITENTCMAVNLFDEDGEGAFEEVLLSDGTTAIFTSIINSGTGFDGNSYDFQMIVLEDGRDTETTTYYFYVEIE